MSEETTAAPTPVRPRDGRFSTMVVSGVLAAALCIAAMWIPVPYVIESPGPTFNTLGKDSGKPVIQVTGQKTYPATGNLDLVTVYESGGIAGDNINIFEALRAWANKDDAVYPAELLYPPGTSQTVVSSQNTAAMTSSQENATAAAMTELGIKYTTALEVAAVPTGTPSAGVLNANDTLLTIDGKPITSLTVIQKALAAGKGAPATVEVKRNGANKTFTIKPAKQSDGTYLLGIEVQDTFTFPFQVNIALSNVGGPSAGMMFALGIIDTLTPGSLTGGKHFAGTGTIDPQGDVGAIGGIAQKMVGARNTGATVFFAPGANCSDVVGHVPAGLQVVKVDKLSQAYDDVKLIGSGGNGSKLPTCQ